MNGEQYAQEQATELTEICARCGWEIPAVLLKIIENKINSAFTSGELHQLKKRPIMPPLSQAEVDTLLNNDA